MLRSRTTTPDHAHDDHDDHDDGELTATQKVRRNIIGKKFAREIELIYGGGTA